MNYKKIFIIYIFLINIISFTMFFIDKRKALKNKWRIKENTLYFVSFFGGSIGSFFSMFLFNHKIKKKKFCFIVLLTLIFNIYIIYKIMFNISSS